MEQPEDLGAMPAGPHQGHRPATMWQWPQHGELVNLGLRSVCLHQSSFGVGYHKPTRLLLKTSLSMPDFVFEGLPMFDDGGYYTGPLPKLATTSTAATGRMVASQATAQWPTKMAEWLAQLALATCATTATTAVPDREPSTQLAIDIDGEPNGDLDYMVNEPEGPRLLGGHGPPRRCHQNDGIKDFHDGGGLCSPGRWPRHRRGYADGASSSSDSRHRRQASGLNIPSSRRRPSAWLWGGENSLVRDSQLHEELLQLLQKWLRIEGQDLSEKDLLAIPPGQPLRLRLLRAILEAAGDPDRDFLRRAEDGLPLGILEGLPRTPHVLEEQTSWTRQRPLGTCASLGAKLCLRGRAQRLREG